MSIQSVINIVLGNGVLTLTDRVQYSMVSVHAAEKLVRVDALLEGISHGGLSGNLRFAFWKWALKRQLKQEMIQDGDDPLEFYSVHSAQFVEASTQTSGPVGEIMRDVRRTFPNHSFFIHDGPGEKMLSKVLIAISIYNPEVGYCQGMNFIAGGLILARMNLDGYSASDADYEAALAKHATSDTESDVFWMLQTMMTGKLDMQSIWCPGFPKMKLRVYQLDRLLLWNLPDLHRHFEHIGLLPEVIVSQWFITLFSNTVPLQDTFCIWDYILLIGWPGVFRITLSLLYFFQDRILEKDMEEIAVLLRDWKRYKFELNASITQVLRKAEQFPIYDDTLSSLHEAFAVEIMYEALGPEMDSSLGVGKSYLGITIGAPQPEGRNPILRYYDISDAMKNDMRRLLHEMKTMEKQVEQDKLTIQRKIMNACESCELSAHRLEVSIQEEAELEYNSYRLKCDINALKNQINSILEANNPSKYEHTEVLHDNIGSDTQHVIVDETMQEDNQQITDEVNELDYKLRSTSPNNRNRLSSVDDSDSEDLKDFLDDSNDNNNENGSESEHSGDVGDGYDDEIIEEDSRASKNEEIISENKIADIVAPESINQVEVSLNAPPTLTDKIQTHPSRRRANTTGVVGTIRSSLPSISSSRLDSDTNTVKTSFHPFPISMTNTLPQSEFSHIAHNRPPSSERVHSLTTSPSHTTGNIMHTPSPTSTITSLTAQNITVHTNESVTTIASEETELMICDEDVYQGDDVDRREDSNDFDVYDNGDMGGNAEEEEYEGDNNDDDIYNQYEERYDDNEEYEDADEDDEQYEEEEDDGSESEYYNQEHVSSAPSQSGAGIKASLRYKVIESGMNMLFKVATNTVHKIQRSNESTNNLQAYEKETAKLQHRITKLTKSLDEVDKLVQRATQKKYLTMMADEEAREWKESLCSQFQQLVRDSNRGRNQKLMYIADNYGV